MPESIAPFEIPKRALFKAGEVCELAKVQSYVLKSWEAEFPDLGVAKAAGGPRVYRREDVELVLRIKHLLLVEGLTLAGARRRLEEEEEVASETAAPSDIDELLGQNARERVAAVRRGLRGLLDLLAARGEAFQLVTPSVPRGARLVAPSRKKAAKAKAGGRRPPRARGR
jgi:DNA-binding transcriptional MerR regulator